MNLSTKNIFPIEIVLEIKPDLFKIPEVTLFIQNEYLTFLIAICFTLQ